MLNPNQIKARRIAQRVTQLEISRATGIPEIRIGRLEAGRAIARAGELEAIATALDMHLTAQLASLGLKIEGTE